MNKKKTCVIQIKSINSLLFCFLKKGFLFFKPSRTRSIDRSLLTQKKTSHPNPQETLFHPLSPTRFDPKKKISMLFSKKNCFFPPPTGIRTHIKKILVSPTACAKRAPRPPIPRARARAPAAAAAAAAAHQHHHLIESGSEKREGYRTSVSTKIRSVSNLCMNPNPLSPRSPFFQPTGQRFPTLARG